MIQPQGVTAQQPAHACHQMALGCFHHQMEMTAHQTVGVNLEIRLLAGLGQSLEKFLAIHLVVENVLPAVPTTQDVVNGAWILDAQLARHGRTLHPLMIGGDAAPTPSATASPQASRTMTPTSP
jgi:hypothetical protein